MNVNKISDHVSYCGVNDRKTALFESLWDLPNGVSYNSYIVRGSEASAIIDGSDAGHAAEFVNHIADALEGKAPDYLIINHIEPDHSGAIPMLKEKYPDIKIVCNAKTVDLLSGFYGIESDVVVMADNDTLSLGDITLRFLLTPMVHWPETMFTYLEEEHILFSGDAFGCFGALNGAVIDEQMNTDIFIPEMYRYYACIVAKYGQFVDKAITKTKGLTIDYICSTHGPVWHTRRDEIGRLYYKMARWEAEAGVVIAYGSMYGNSTMLAEEIAARLAGLGIKEIRLHDVSHSPQSHILADIMRFKGLVIVSPTYNSEIFPPVASLATALSARGIKNRIIGIAGSYSWGAQAVRKLRAVFSDKPVTLIDPSPEMKQARKEPTVKPCDELAENMAALLAEGN